MRNIQTYYWRTCYKATLKQVCDDYREYKLSYIELMQHKGINVYFGNVARFLGLVALFLCERIQLLQFEIPRSHRNRRKEFRTFLQ